VKLRFGEANFAVYHDAKGDGVSVMRITATDTTRRPNGCREIAFVLLAKTALRESHEV
jgi:hypothetical protein